MNKHDAASLILMFGKGRKPSKEAEKDDDEDELDNSKALEMVMRRFS